VDYKDPKKTRTLRNGSKFYVDVVKELRNLNKEKV
jgi:hypothetical protein